MIHGDSKGRVLCSLVSAGLAAVSLVLVLTTVRSGSSFEEDPWREHRAQLAPPVPEPVRACWYGHMCNGVVTGTAGGTWVFEGPDGDLDAIQDYHTAVFDQKILERSKGRVTVRIRSRAVLETEARFPLNPGTLPPEIQRYLEPERGIQSEAPVIVHQAEQLVDGARMEAQAVVAILDWVRANISYDYSFSLPNDAVSVYENGSGVCAGFSNLSVALLRAAGVPARVTSGCALWSLPSGGGHAWIEVYYPDVGWVPSEPQDKQNYADLHLVAPRWYEFCGESSTSMTYTERIPATDLNQRSRTAYDDSIWGSVTSAHVPAWDRNPARSSVSGIWAMVEVSHTQMTRRFEVESTHCYTTLWSLEASEPWLKVTPTQGYEPTMVTLSVTTSTLPLGLHTGALTMVTPEEWRRDAASRTIPVSVRVVEEVRESFLPIVQRGGAVE